MSRKDREEYEKHQGLKNKIPFSNYIKFHIYYFEYISKFFNKLFNIFFCVYPQPHCTTTNTNKYTNKIIIIINNI